MSELSELGQVLHEEHFRILVAVCGLENRITGSEADRPLDPADGEDRRLLQGLIASLDHIIVHHFFEETVVFPLFRDHGDGELTTLLTREHGEIEPKSRRLRSLSVALVGQRPDAVAWAEFCDAGRKLVAEVMRHLEKEELTIVQRLPQFLDADIDHELAVRQIARRSAKSPVGLADADGGRSGPRACGGAGPVVGRAAPVHAAARAAARRRASSPPNSLRP